MGFELMPSGSGRGWFDDGLQQDGSTRQHYGSVAVQGWLEKRAHAGFNEGQQ